MGCFSASTVQRLNALFAYLTDDARVLTDLIAELLIHPHNHRVGRFDVLESGLEALTDLRGTFDSAASRKDFVG
jgi:hypothetical protein